ncbi:MAG: hypothetical protein IJV99_01435 [Clostridia bacterium]|nr:hypothetical protein [Clostridia bacterium]
MKKLTVILLTLCLALTSIFFTACKEQEKGDKDKKPETTYYLALNEYDLTLDVGDTFALDVKKYDSNGKEQTIKEITYGVEATAVASVENGVITAKETGKTYVNVTADGIDVACFLTVRRADYIDGLTIRMTAKDLYKGLPVHAYAYVYEENVLKGLAENVTWSVSDQEKATVSSDGVVTPKELTDGLTLTASCVYNGETLTAEKQIAIIEPYYYAMSSNMVKLASNTTLSGKTNDKHVTATGLSLKKINVLDGQVLDTVTDVSVFSANTEIATATANEQGVITVNGLKAGETAISVIANDTGKQVAVKAIVYNAIKDVADMDILGFASLLNVELLSQNYVLVSDIDYNGQVIIPIATIKDTNTRVVGNQWKFWLNKTESGYTPVARADFGKEGQGLSDSDFSAFAGNNGINPQNLPFTGVFDGNGYTIKNGQIFYGAMLFVSGNNAYSVYSSVIGNLQGTLKNISFEGITQQDPATLKANGVDITKYSETASLQINATTGVYVTRGMGLVGKATNATIENVYADITFTLSFTSTNYGTDKSIIAVEFGQDVKVSNCVLESIDGGKEADYAIDSGLTGSSVVSSVKNCFALGTSRFYKQFTGAGSLGVNGCWWLGNGKTWKDLLSATSTNSSALSVEQVKASFDTRVWDMSKFNATDNGRPALIKGCSFA